MPRAERLGDPWVILHPGATEWRGCALGRVDRPSIAIVVHPYLYATALARVFSDRGYDVTVPNLMTEEWDPSGRYDVVMTCLPLEVDGDPIRVDIPTHYEDHVRVSVSGVAVELHLDPIQPVRDLVRVLGSLVEHPSRSAAVTHLTSPDIRERHRR